MYLVIWTWKGIGLPITSYVCIYKDKKQAESDIILAQHKLESLQENQRRIPETYDPQDSAQTYKFLQKIFTDLNWPEIRAPGSENFHEIKFRIESIATKGE